MKDLEILVKNKDYRAIFRYIIDHNNNDTFSILDSLHFYYPLTQAPKEIKDNIEYLKRYYRIYYKLPKFAFHGAIYQDKDFLLEVLQGHPCYYSLLTPKYQLDFDVCSIIFIKYAISLKEANPLLYDDEHFMLECFKYNNSAWRYFSSRLINNEEFMLKCINNIKHGFHDDNFPKQYLTEKYAKLLISKSGLFLKYFPELKEEYSELAFSENVYAIDYCSESYLNDLNIVKRAIKKSFRLIFHFDKTIATNKELALELIHEDYYIINDYYKYYPDFVNDPDILVEAYLSYNKNYYKKVNNNVILFLKRFYHNLYFKDLFNVINEYESNYFSLNEDDFKKMLNLFNDNNLSMNDNDINNLIHLISNQLYLQENHERLYTNIICLIKLGSDKLTDYLNRLFPNNHLNIALLLKNDSNEIAKLHHLCADYEEKVKGLYEKENHDKLDSYINYQRKNAYNKNDVIKYLFKQEFDVLYNKLNLDQEFNYNDLKEVFLSFKNNKKIINKALFNQFINKISLLNKNGLLCEFIGDNLDYEKELVYDSNFILNIFLNEKAHINITDELLSFLSKTKLLAYTSNFNQLFKMLNIDFNDEVVNNILICYDKLKDTNVLKVIDKSIKNDYYINKLKVLLSEDLYKIYYENKGTYRGRYSTKKRLLLLPNLVKNLLLKPELSVPNIEGNYLINDTNIKVYIDNHSLKNICLGEIVDSCVRLGADANDLYINLLKDPNFFNIIFEVDNQVVGKISGFHAGNNLILNQLRSNNKIDDIILQKALYLFSNDLVNSSSREEQIKHIFCSRDKVMANEPKVYVPELACYCNLREREFYYDFANTDCVLLAGDLNNIEHYEPSVSYDNLFSVNESDYPDEINCLYNQFKLKSWILDKQDITKYEFINTDDISKIYYGNDYIIYEINGDLEYEVLNNNENLINKVKEFMKNKKINSIKY